MITGMGFDVEKYIDDTNVHPKTVKRKYYKSLVCRIQLCGQQHQR